MRCWRTGAVYGSAFSKGGVCRLLMSRGQEIAHSPKCELSVPPGARKKAKRNTAHAITQAACKLRASQHAQARVAHRSCLRARWRLGLIYMRRHASRGKRFIRMRKNSKSGKRKKQDGTRWHRGSTRAARDGQRQTQFRALEGSSLLSGPFYRIPARI